MFATLILSGIASRENVRGLEAAARSARRGVRQPPLHGGVHAEEPRPRLPALVPPLHPHRARAAAAHPLPAAAGQERRPARGDGRRARLPALPARPRVEPLPLRLLPQGGALPRRLRGAGLPRAVPGRRQPRRGLRADGGRRQPPAGLGARPLRPARLPPRRRSARDPLEADGAHRRAGVHRADRRAQPAACRSSSTTRSGELKGAGRAEPLRAAGERGGDDRRRSPGARLRGRAGDARGGPRLRRAGRASAWRSWRRWPWSSRGRRGAGRAARLGRSARAADPRPPRRRRRRRGSRDELRTAEAAAARLARAARAAAAAVQRRRRLGGGAPLHGGGPLSSCAGRASIRRGGCRPGG